MAKKTNPLITPKEEYSYGHIINALAGGLYPNKFHVIREYVQNSFDAIVKWKEIHRTRDLKIEVSIQKPSIFIYDNGTGMNRHTLNEYRKVGFSKKQAGEHAGFRGIGKLAGISVAKKLIVTTSPYGTSEKYMLTFDAEAMLDEINNLKKQRQNISLNSLIKTHTDITSEVAKKSEHYTFVELQEIKDDSKILFKESNLMEYLSRNVPVPFDPNFKQGAAIEEDIKRFVSDYNYANITVNNKNIYKPFVNKLRQYKHIIVWDSKTADKQTAYCWYCENTGKGQIKPIDKSGLVFRYKNFAVGDNHLTRTTIWTTSSHLAFYYIGEIYIIDRRITPTSQRDDFEHNTARDQFYKDVRVISNELNSIARTSSDQRRAKEYVENGFQTVSRIEKDVKQKESYLQDLSTEKISELVSVVKNINKRKKNIPPKDKQTITLANNVVRKANKLLGEFENIKDEEIQGYNIIKKLNLGKQARDVYMIIIRTLKDSLVDKPDVLESIIKKIHQAMCNSLSK